MYRSPVLKKGMEHLYTTEPWCTAIKFPWFPELSRVNPSKDCPPFSFVAFVATAVSQFAYSIHISNYPNKQYCNALDCLVTGTEEKVPLSEVGYSEVFDDVFSLVQGDTDHPDHGKRVLANIGSLIANITV